MNPINTAIYPNLGLGDAIIINPIVRKIAKQSDLVCLVAKHQNVPTINFMFRDIPNFVVRGVDDDAEADMFMGIWKNEKLRLHGHGQEWDKMMYAQAQMLFELRWSDWFCLRDKHQELPHMGAPVFVHEDPKRGIRIDPARMDLRGRPFDIPRPGVSPNLFSWWGIIEQAEEIHCIVSSFSAFIDSVELFKNPKLFLHTYARKGEPIPQYKKNWTILT